ncbi:MAG: beta-galactosidase [Fimbriimonadaceae bacterium]|nr:beta-galactosidase [Fimbriimonadaceae bacterium]
MRGLCWMLWVGAACAAPGDLTLELQPLPATRNLLPNASFEQLAAGQPRGWVFDRRNTDATCTPAPGHSGQQALRFTNGTAFGAHVYGQLRLEQELVVQPGRPYVLSFYTRSEGSPGHAWVGGATGWRFRVGVPATQGRWVRVSATFQTQADETRIPLMVNTDSPTSGFEIDDLQLEPGTQPTPFDAPDTPLPAAISVLPASKVQAAPWKPATYPPDAWCFADREAWFEGGLRLPAAEPARLTATLRHGATVLATARRDGDAPPRAAIRLRYELPSPPPEAVDLHLQLSDAAGHLLCEERRACRLVTRGLVEARLAALEPRLPALEARARDDDYLRVSATVLRRFGRYVREDLESGALARAWDTVLELDRLATAAAAAPTRQRVPRFVTSPVQTAGAAQTATVALPDGTRRQQPVYFVGYGHFAQVKRDVEEFPSFGHNLIQVEFGPRSVLPAEGQVSTAEIEAFRQLCARAAAANVQVNLLLSPHYFPDWALAKWPHLREFDGGFLRYSVYAPEARQVLEASIRATIRGIRDLPALHSVCLSNEPLSIDLTRCRFAADLWRQWVERRYRNIAAANAVWGTRFESFAALTVPPPKFEASPLLVDFIAFHQEAFADWHRWMADLVRQEAPQLAVHAKIMMSAHFTPNLHGCWSVAPELFAQFSQLNGNDCCKWPRSADWACDWLGENMGYDYQRSAADRPVFNSENHLILDRDVGEVDPGFVRNVYWQGALHGQAATTTWVWERTNEAGSDFTGSILHRPACVEAAGQVTLDLNRAAPQVAALAAAPAPVALLWSQSSTIWRGSPHVAELTRAYAAASFSGHAVGFINERDCAAFASGQPNRAFGQARLILIPGATHLPQTALDALRRFADLGGKLLWLGPGGSHDEYGQARRGSAPAHEPAPADWAATRELAATISRLLPPAAVPLAVWGVEARSALLDGRRLANVCNYLPEPVRVDLPPGAQDLLRGTPVGESLTLAPLESRLLGW